ncbi:MAG: sugar transferase [Candidatus Sericytochromatia bacterium]|nr:sugar transferase [Candidatus Sericytochromatia bacterium]
MGSAAVETRSLPWEDRLARLGSASHPSLYGLGGAVKRLLDIAGATVGLVCLFPVLLLVALAVRWDSPGPVFFRQERVGWNGRRFKILKFRTMVVDAEARRAELEALNEIPDGPIFKMKDDPRVTRVGRFLRRSSLDEFPQLINILLGDMSLVGPRPPLPAEVEDYSDRDLERLRLMPGATGAWQVTERRGGTSFREMVELDLRYAAEWSVWKDFVILMRTVLLVLRLQGSR